MIYNTIADLIKRDPSDLSKYLVERVIAVSNKIGKTADAYVVTYEGEREVIVYSYWGRFCRIIYCHDYTVYNVIVRDTVDMFSEESIDNSIEEAILITLNEERKDGPMFFGLTYNNYKFNGHMTNITLEQLC